MICPVCESQLDLPENISSELYYDCPRCLSSLLIKDEKCEVLSEGDLNWDKDAQTEVPILDQSETTTPATAQEKDSETSEVEELDTTKSSAEFTQDNTPEDSVEQDELEKPEELDEDASVSSEMEADDDDNKEPDSTAQNKEEVENFSSLEEFASKSVSLDSVFLYDLLLKEINSMELKQKVEDILQDPLLSLDQEAQDLTVKEGRIKIEKISPIKVHVIVRALMGLSIEISWEQHLALDK